MSYDRSGRQSAVRKLSQFVGLGNESSSNYFAAPWSRDLDPDSSPEYSDATAESVHEEAPNDSQPGGITKRLSVFFAVETDRVPPRSADGGEGPPPERRTSELVQKVKRKMSSFLAMTRPAPETSETPAEASASSPASSHRDLELPTFHHGKEQTPTPAEGSGKKKAPKQPQKARKRGAPIQSQHQVHMLSTLQLISITFFAVSGGPYGFEPTVGAGGPGLMLVGLLLFPALWAAPLAFMTAELSCMIPESGGHVLWVYRAFGPFWSFVNSCFAFACSVLDNAMYPVLFVEYLSALLYEGKNSIPYGWSVFLKIFIVFIVTIINILGVNIVGLTSVVLGFMVLAPFMTMCLIGLGHLNFDWMGLDSTDQSNTATPPVVDWGKFVTLLLWNTSGFDAAGTCAAEVRNPGHAFPRALVVSVALMVGVYAVPTIIGVSVLPDYQQWKEGTYIIVAKLIGGDILKVPTLSLSFLGSWVSWSVVARV